jgi:hypothetical protein
MKLGLAYKNFAAYQGISHIGLGVSAQKTAEYLNKRGYDAVVIPAKHNVDVVDAIRKYDFTHMVIMAPWLSGLDVDSMVRHFKKVKFAIISHSNIGFLQADPGALKLFRQYDLIAEEVDNLIVGGNSVTFSEWFASAYQTDTILLPNLYEVDHVEGHPWSGTSLRIGAFGAIRPQKNVVTAAASAMLLARYFRIPIEFNVSTGREDGGGSVVLNAVRQMMFNVPGVELVERHWSDRRDFRRIIHEMDILFQVSYTESFNMVTADGIEEGVPSVTSDAITWVPEHWKAQSDNVFNIAAKAKRLLENRDKEIIHGRAALNRHNDWAFKFWQEFLGE